MLHVVSESEKKVSVDPDDEFQRVPVYEHIPGTTDRFAPSICGYQRVEY